MLRARLPLHTPFLSRAANATTRPGAKPGSRRHFGTHAQGNQPSPKQGDPKASAQLGRLAAWVGLAGGAAKALHSAYQENDPQSALETFVYRELDEALQGKTTPGGIKTGLRLKTRVYDATSPKISRHPIRSAVSASTGPLGLPLFWTENEGIIDLEKKLSFDTPPLLGDAQFKTGLKGVATYRILWPHQSSWTDFILSRKQPSHPIPLPLEASLARQMPAGAEVELSAQGTKKAALTLSQGPKASVGPLRGEAGGRAALTYKDSDTFRLQVQSLDGHGKVRLSLEHLDAKSQEAMASLLGRVSLSLDKVGPTDTSLPPELSQALSKSGNIKALKKDLEKTFDVQVRASLGQKDKTKEAEYIVFDLNMPAAARAFNALTRLQVPDTAALEKSAAVERISLRESERQRFIELGAHLSGNKRAYFKALQSHQERALHTSSGDWLEAQRATYSQSHKAWPFGSKSIAWHAVSLQDDDATTPSYFYRLDFSANLNVASPRELERLFRLAHVLAAQPTGEVDTTPDELPWLTRLLSSRDNTHVGVDIYFDEAGIRSIDQVGKAEATSAYLRTLARLEPESFGDIEATLAPQSQAHSLCCAYNALETTAGQFEDPFSELPQGNPLARQALKQRYRALVGRPIAADARALGEAMHFGQALDSLVLSSDNTSLRNFFSDLGQSHGYGFERTLAALGYLAGDDHTLVHEFSLSGGGVFFQALDEGAFTSPKSRIEAILKQSA